MKSLNTYISEGLADWSDDKLDKKMSKQTTKTAIKKEIIDWIMDNFSREFNQRQPIVKSKIKINFDSNNIIVDYDGDLYIKYRDNTGSVINRDNYTNGLFQWGKISGDFRISSLPIKDLSNGPEEVGGKFFCANCNELESLEGGPKRVGELLLYELNSLKSLKYGPTYAKKILIHKCVELSSLNGCPEKISSVFECIGCPNLKSLKGIPKCEKINIDMCGIETLEGCPDEVQEFNIWKCNNVKSFKGGPKKTRMFKCFKSDVLKTLEGAPEKTIYMYCDHCANLESLKGAPKEVQYFSCEKAPKLTSLEGLPEDLWWLRIDDCNGLNDLKCGIKHIHELSHLGMNPQFKNYIDGYTYDRDKYVYIYNDDDPIIDKLNKHHNQN